MIYNVKITSDKADEIEIGKSDKEEERNLITGIEILMDTVNDDVRQKSPAMLAKITIRGQISDIINSELMGLFNWSKELDESKWYRKLEMQVKTSDDVVLRTYEFENVFVVDYLESYTTEGEQDSTSSKEHFELKLTQKENNFKKIETY